MIPKKMHTIRVWPLPPPMKWINSRKEKHPDWEYKLRWNEELNNTQWINQKAIDHYASKWLWNWVADCMRYEILFNHWWVLVWADWLCLNSLNWLFDDWYEAYQIDTSNYWGFEQNPLNIWCAMPLFACEKWFAWAKKLIEMIWELTVYRSPPKSTWNRLMQKLNNNYDFWIKTIPMHQFIPKHFNWREYKWTDKIYSIHYRWTTRWTYWEWL